jgi:hypothetical protein
MMSETLSMLLVHKENISKAKTYEEYRDAQVAWVDMLIAKEQAKIATEIVVAWSEKETIDE